MTSQFTALVLCVTLSGVALAACSDDSPKKESACKTCDHARLEARNKAARACEALVEAKGGAVSGVSFDASLEGRAVHEGDRSGIAWITKTDSAPKKNSTTLEFTGTLSLLSSQCYDVDGKLIDAALELVLMDEASTP